MTELQKQVKKFCEDNELTCSIEFRLLDLVSELGEVAKEVIKSSKYGKLPAKATSELEEEIGDLQFSLCCIANQSGTSLELATQTALQKYQRRLDSKGHVGSD